MVNRCMRGCVLLAENNEDIRSNNTDETVHEIEYISFKWYTQRKDSCSNGGVLVKTLNGLYFKKSFRCK